MKTCKNCGAANEDRNLNCTNCGAPFEMAGAPKQNVQPVPPQPRPQPRMQQPPQQPGYQPGYYQQPPQKQGMSKTTMTVLIVAIIAIAAVAIAGIAILKGNSGAPEESTTSVSEATTEATTQAPSTTKAPETTANQTQPSLKKARPSTTAAPNYYDAYYYDMENYWLDSEYVTDDYLDTLTKDECDYLRNAPYAWHGYIFKKDKYWDYFNTISWYSGYETDMKIVESQFNSVESKNVAKIAKYEKARGWM